MAWYNTITDKIEGAQPGTIKYKHEERHQWQSRQGLLKIEATAAFFVTGAVSYLLWFMPPAPIVIDLAKYLVAGYFLYIVGLELDAWVYSATH